MANETEPVLPRKPINQRVMLIVVVGLLAVGVLLSSLVSYFATSQPSAQPGEVPPSVATKPQVDQFNQGLAQVSKTIRDNTENARKVLALVEALHTQPPPPCTAQLRSELRGRYYVLKSNAADQPDINLVCQEDNQWAVLPPSLGEVAKETPQQKHAEQGVATNGTMSAAEKIKLRRQAVFQSNPIPLHFADQEQSGTRKEEALIAKPYAPGELPGPASVSTPMFAPSPSDPAGRNQLRSTPASAPAVPLGVQLSGSVGEKYPIFEGKVIEGLLMNRLIGQQDSFVKVQTTTPVYSRDGQHLLIPAGAVVLGEAARVSASGQTRLAVVFHRIIMPDGYSILLAGQPKGLNQQGATGLTGRVNNHLASLIGTAVMVGAIEGLSDFANVGSAGAVVQIQGGMSREAGTEAMQILRVALNRPPSVTVYEGTRVRFLIVDDFLLPAYENHVVKETVE